MSLASLSLEQVNHMMDQIIKHHVFHLVLTGGEPLLNKKALFRILELSKENGITTSVNSTLITLTEEEALRFKELGVTVVLTSILGPTAEIHNEIAQQDLAFEKTIQGIKILQKAKVPVSVNMVISKKNNNLIRETAKLVKSLGLKSFNATRAGCPGNCSDFSKFSLDLQEFRSYLEELNDFGNEEKMPVDVLSAYPLCGIKEVNRYQKFSSRRCMAGVNTVTLSATGDIRPCGHIDVSYGNLMKDDLAVIWQRMIEWRDGSLIPETCKSCKLLRQCGGGCRMEAKTRNGSISKLDPYASPSDADYVFSQLTSRDKKKFPLPVMVHLNQKIRWRTENFGATIFVGVRFGCYLNNQGLIFIQSLEQGKEYLITDLMKNIEKDQENFLSGLVERNILISTNVEEKKESVMSVEKSKEVAGF
jgi:radical SAM protein with 4Fe4S-binding SPASM domain